MFSKGFFLALSKRFAVTQITRLASFLYVCGCLENKKEVLASFFYGRRKGSFGKTSIAAIDLLSLSNFKKYQS